MAGVGKTELAIQAARSGLAAEWFPGGVLFVDLYGYDDVRRPRSEVVLDGLLRALGVPAEVIPSREQDRSRLYRSVLSGFAERGNQVLLILDNASSLEQLKPLLPSDRNTAVVITSRDTLATIGTEHGAHRLDLDVLDPSSACHLMARATSRNATRLADDPEAALEIAQLCGYLPLALQIVATLLVENPVRAVRVVANDLADTRSRLTELDHPDKAVRASFDLSYRRLTGEQAGMLRLLGLNAGPDISTDAAAALTGQERHAARRILEALVRGHLVEPGAIDNRWRLHDLVRVYAIERAHAEDSYPRCQEAIARLLGYCAENADAAAAFVGLGAGEDGQGHFENRSAALAWLHIEHRNLLAALEFAGQDFPLDLVVRISADLAGFALWRGDETESMLVTERGVQAAHGLQKRPDNSGLPEHGTAPLDFIRALHTLGLVMIAEQRFNEVIFVYRLAADVATKVPDPILMKTAMNAWAEAAAHAGQVDEARRVYEITSDLYRVTGDRSGEGEALCSLGSALRKAGHVDEAAHAFREAIDILHEIGNRPSERVVLTLLGDLMEETGQLTEAADCYRRAVAISGERGGPASGRHASHTLGRVLQKAGRHEEAIGAYRRTVELYQRLSDHFGRGMALFDLGHMLHGLSRFDEAADTYRHCVGAFREIGRTYDEAKAHANLCLALVELRRYSEARTHGELAVKLFGEAGAKDDVKRAHTLLQQLSRND
jgi:tetratricopeptide (TPR) repeat protein